jgi:hypothetical protein
VPTARPPCAQPSRLAVRECSICRRTRETSHHIELCWSKVKTLVRAAAARTRAAILDAVASALNRVTAADAHAWFRHCGYHQPVAEPL